SGDGVGESSSQPSRPSSAERALRASFPRIEAKPGEGRQESISHFPLEQDPDDSVPAYAVPGPPRVPSAPRAGSGGVKPSGPPGPILASTTAANTAAATMGRTTSPSAGVGSPALTSSVPASSSPSGVPGSPSGRRGTHPSSDRAERAHDAAQVAA